MKRFLSFLIFNVFLSIASAQSADSLNVSAPKDSAASKTIDKAVCYDAADICEGIFKPGYTRLLGEVIERPENAGFIYKYSYKGSDFIFNGNTDDGSEFLRNTDGSLIPLNIVSVFNILKSRIRTFIKYQ